MSSAKSSLASLAAYFLTNPFLRVPSPTSPFDAGSRVHCMRFGVQGTIRWKESRPSEEDLRQQLSLLALCLPCLETPSAHSAPMGQNRDRDQQDHLHLSCSHFLAKKNLTQLRPVIQHSEVQSVDPAFVTGDKILDSRRDNGFTQTRSASGRHRRSPSSCSLGRRAPYGYDQSHLRALRP